MKILTHLDLSQNELQNAVLHKLATAPTSPVVGQIYFNTTDKQAYIYQQTGWENLGLSNELLEKLENIEEGADKAFYDEMPTASAANVGKVAIYAGEDTEDFKAGLVYVCEGSASTGYSWKEAIPTMTGATTNSVEVTVDEGVVSADVVVSAAANNAIQIKTVEGVEGLYVEATEVGPATEDEDGLMTAEDKEKLDGIEEGAEVNVLEGVKLNGVAIAVAADKTSNIIINNATTSAAGLMAAADKVELAAATSKNTEQDSAITALEAKDTELEGLIEANAEDIEDLQENKQDVIVAGTNITINADGKTINATIPIASANTLGGIKIGEGLEIDPTTGILDVVEGGKADSVEWTGVLNKPSTLGTEGMTAGTYAKVTVDKYGLVTAGDDLEADDIPDLSDTYVNVDEKGSADGVATLDSNGKIEFEQLPDAIIGNVRYGGTVGANGVCSLVNGKIIDDEGQEVTSLTITSSNAEHYKGYYFISTVDATIAGIDFLIGDWCISNGTAGWKKVDNTDAVTGIKGAAESTYRIGQVNITAANVGAVEANTAITGGTFAKVTVDAKGLVTAGSEQITTDDISDFETVAEGFVAVDQGSSNANKALVTDADGNVTTVVHKYVTSIGDGTATSYTVTHNMGTKDIIVQVSDATTFEVVYANIAISTNNQITLNFAQAPAANAYRVLILA